MAEPKQESPDLPLPPLPFLEVVCKSSGITRRFAPGTKTGFALSLINNKIDSNALLALYIEAVKDGEEPVNFGPSSILLSYGIGWKLQTVLETNQGVKKRQGVQVLNKSFTKKQASEPELEINFLYFGKILLVFLFILLLAGGFTLVLESLPNLLLFFNSAL